MFIQQNWRSGNIEQGDEIYLLYIPYYCIYCTVQLGCLSGNIEQGGMMYKPQDWLSDTIEQGRIYIMYM
jgi:hypothetical protein